MRFSQYERVSTQVETWLPRPTIIPLTLGPELWFDAADTITITASSNSVSQLNDKSGNNRHLKQATAANQPTSGTNTINSLNVLTFDGVNDGLATDNFSSLSTQHFFAVVKPTSFPFSYNSVMSHEANATGFTLLAKSTGKLAIYGSGSGTVNYDGSGTYTLSSGTCYLLEYSWSGTRLIGYVNAQTDGDVLQTFTVGQASSPFRIGFSFFSSRNWAGDIAEVILFNSVLTTSKQNEVRNYLNNKWAIY